MTAVPIRARSTSAQEEAEWKLRTDLAAVFRIHARFGWNEQIGNHHSVMLPGGGDKPLFLINPRGLLFQELTASNLIVCDLEGNVVSGKGELRKVAFFIHARIHLANPKAVAVLHVHPQYLTALSMIDHGRLELCHLNNLTLNDRIAYDEEAPGTINVDEGDRYARVLGDKTILIMPGHGVTVVGPTIEEAFDELSGAERTAMYQITAMQSGQKLLKLPDDARRRHLGPIGERWDSRMHLDAWRRILDKETPDYAN
ncbi:MAG: aldolase [Alphaproteobacteria bacterium]|nr:aldolase [Alphaproteobacteria bacterium]